MPTAFQEEVLRAIQKCNADAGAHDWEIVRHVNFERGKSATLAAIDARRVTAELLEMEKQGFVMHTAAATWKVGK